MGVDDSSRAIFNRLQADRHFVVVAALNLVKALDKLGLTSEVAALAPVHVRALRNCLEHWDDGVGPSFTKLEQLVPGGDPLSHTWGAAGTIIGGIDFDELVRDVVAYRTKLLELENSGWAWKRSPSHET